MQPLVRHAAGIGAKYVGLTMAVIGFAFTLVSFGNADWSNPLALLFVVTIVAGVGICGAIAGFVLFPAMQALVSALRIPPHIWPSVQALIGGCLFATATLIFLLWMYRDWSGVVRNFRNTEMALFMAVTVGGVICGFLFGNSMQQYASSNDDQGNKPPKQ